MKASYLHKLFKKYISDNLPGFSIQGHLIYDINSKLILRGFCFEDSAFDANSFNMYVFVQPLFIPKDYLWFNFSERLNSLSEKGVDRWWSISLENEPAIMQEVLRLMQGPGLKYLKKIQDPQDLIKVFRRKQNETPQDFSALEAFAYSEILSRDYQKAYFLLANLSFALEKAIKLHPEAKWMNETKTRVSIIEKFIVEKEFEAAHRQLLLWEKSTKEALKL